MHAQIVQTILVRKNYRKLDLQEVLSHVYKVWLIQKFTANDTEEWNGKDFLKRSSSMWEAMVSVKMDWISLWAGVKILQ